MGPREPIDPRAGAIADRLADVSRVVAVAGSKGGIGKSIVASILALTSADAGLRVGLLDLDFTSPTDHVVLGVTAGFPTETFGIDPHRAHGIDVMSVAFLSGNRPTPLRGAETTSALLELLAITRWGDLDLLILDMPPGLGDMTMDVIRLIPRADVLLVANASRMVIDCVRRASLLFEELGAPIVGIVDNMQRVDNSSVADLAAEFKMAYLGTVPFDGGLEEALGVPAQLRSTDVYQAIADCGRFLLPG